MKARYTANALADMASIFEHIARDNPRAAANVVERIKQTVSRLELFPLTGHRCDIPRVLVAPLGRYPYSIYYQVTDREVLILHLRHGARLPPTQL